MKYLTFGSIPNAHALENIASKQFGYFTAKQAIECHYSYELHSYHMKVGNWNYINKGLFRLPNYSDCMEADFTRWCLWSRNQQDQPQGIISYNSSLAFYGLVEYIPSEIHLTVPPRFRKKTPNEIITHKASLNLSAIEYHCSFMITRLGQTLSDMRSELEAKGEWNAIVRKVVAENRLSSEEMTSLGISTGNNTENLDIQSERENTVDPISEGVWKMIFDKTEAGRRGSRAGFTLVELLVVIAIISILAAMLMPALGKALDGARNTACQNNLKQVYFAASLYGEDFGGYFPATWENYGGTSCFWSYRLSSYLGEIEGTNFCRAARCPAAQRMKLAYACVNVKDTTDGTSYFSATGRCYRSPIPAMMIDKPSRIAYLADASGRPETDLYPWDSTWVGNLPLVSSCWFEERHNGRANWLFYDGHTKSYTRTQIKTNDFASAQMP